MRIDFEITYRGETVNLDLKQPHKWLYRLRFTMGIFRMVVAVL
jgi:hypothetical protein